MKNHKSIILTSLLLANVVLIPPVLSATAQEPKKQEKSFLLQFLETYNSLQKSIDKYTKDFSFSWENVIKGVDTLIKGTNGDLGTPDPVSAGERIRKAIEKNKKSVASGDSATVVPTLETPDELDGQNAQRDWHQKYTKAQSQATLGADGQRIQAQEAEMSNYAVANSSENAEAAQQDVITQDILKKIAVQNLQGTIINKSLHSEAQKQTRALAAANINLADISSRMDEQAKEQERQTRATVRNVIQSSAAIDVFWANQ
ncbi:hypothetical protein LC593_30140 [Nostoc sp. CHAB 5844]|nr:hypothetical protein [Nostoc sp. CHAB 5844]